MTIRTVFKTECVGQWDNWRAYGKDYWNKISMMYIPRLWNKICWTDIRPTFFQLYDDISLYLL